MIRLDASLSGIIVDLSEGDAEGAMASFRDFRDQYRETAELVPEWSDGYPDAPVEELGRALERGERPAVMAAVEKVGESCHSCHVSTMVRVQQKFRWGNFASIRTKDPLLGQETDFATFKRFLSTSLTGVTHNLRQGQIGNARKQFAELNARFQTLKSTCFDCHADANRRFVGSDVQELLDQTEKALAGDGVTSADVEPLLQRFGRESCSGCHLVHVPAALAAK